MTMLDTFDHEDFAATEISRKLRGMVSVVIPTRNTAGTIAQTVAELNLLVEDGLVGQILVVDADSADGTASLARDAGAEVRSENELVDGFGPCRGKGDAMWRALAAVTGEPIPALEAPSFSSSRSTIICVAIPAWSVPGTHSASEPFILFHLMRIS